MAGGLIQLLAWGSQNIKLNGNPSITFFKKVLKSHTNFSMESTRLNLNRTSLNVYENTILKKKIERHGDLVQEVYLVLELPDIKPNDLEFHWIENLGEAIIDNYYVTIGGSIVDRQYGEQLHVQNLVSMSSDKRKIYDRMIGNVDELVAPSKRTGTYPTTSPAIPSRKLYIPLNFWFNRDSGCALPLVCLQYSETEISIELRPLIELCRIVQDGVVKAPSAFDSEQRFHNFVSNDRVTYMSGETVVDMRAYLEVNYYFVDTKEREYIAYHPHEYLIEQTFRIQRFSLMENNIFEMLLQNPVKEILWVLKRSDQGVRNDWHDFTDEGQHILTTAKLMFNGMDRFDEKDAGYFNYIQPFQYHKACPKDGIYIYSFSLQPDEGLNQPSGSCNMSRVNKIQMMLNTIKPKDTTYHYDVNIYAIGYNFLKISSGLAGIVFSN